MNLLEEFDITNNFQVPHLMYHPIDSTSKKRVAANIFGRSNEAILLITPEGLGRSSVFAGLTQNHLEHIALHAPVEHKAEIFKLLDNSAEIEDILNIAKGLDEDMGGNTTKNLDRVKKNIQYVRNNKVVFESKE